MTRILGIILSLALAAAIVPQGAPPAEAAKKKAAKNSSTSGAAKKVKNQPAAVGHGNFSELMGISSQVDPPVSSRKKGFRRR